MKLIGILSIFGLVAVFAAVYGYNTTQPKAISLTPPYAFTPNELVSELLAVGFVFAFSLLFFGYGAPLALAIEGAKFGSLFSTGAVHWTYLLFAIPEVLVAFSAIYLGQGLLLDYQGKGLWHEYSNKSILFLVGGILIWAAVFFGRKFIPL